MSKPKLIVTRKWPQEIEQILSQKYDVSLNEDDHPMTHDELKDSLRTADALLSTVTDKINAEVLSKTPLKTKLLANFGVGFNHIDLDAAKKRGLVITNTPEVLTDATADIAILLMLMSARRGAEGDRHIRSREWIGWRPTHMLGTTVTGKTLGLIGMGRIAQATARRAHHGFGMKIIFSAPRSPSPNILQELDATPCETIEELLKTADFVSLHCPGEPATYHLLNEEKLKLMRPTAHLINTARGDVVDNQALIQALRNGSIAGAGLDVFEGEPNLDDAFLSLDNVSLLPHLGSATLETRVAMGKRVIENIDAFFNHKEPRDRVV